MFEPLDMEDDVLVETRKAYFFVSKGDFSTCGWSKICFLLREGLGTVKVGTV